MRLSQAGFALGAGVFNTYLIVPSALSVNEGAPLSVEVKTVGIANGTTLYWTINNITSTNADFSATSGSFTVTSGVGTFNVNLSADATTEGPESFSISIRRGSITGLVVSTSDAIGINDTSMTPSYSVTPSTSSVDEGQDITFTVNTVNVPSGTVLYWTTTGSVSTSDFTDNTLTGTITISNNTATIVRTLRPDKSTEGGESLAIQIRTGSTSGPVVVTSSTVAINDTSTVIYSVTPNASSVLEGGSVTFTVIADDAPNGTVLYWTTKNITGTAATTDFSDGALSGSFTISGNTASFTRTIVNDIDIETESFAIEIRTGSTSGTVVATSSTVTINDVRATVTPNTTSINEGGTITFTVSTTNIANGTTLYWTTPTSTGITASDFSDSSLTGSITVNNDTATITRTLVNDAFTEGTEYFQIAVRIGSLSGTIIGLSSTITINDTSTTVPGQFVYVPSASSSANNATATTTWTVPAGVTSISVVCVGGGGAGPNLSHSQNRGGYGGAGGGGLSYINNYPVIPGQVLTVGGGRGGGLNYSTDTGGQGGQSYVNNAAGTTFVSAFGGQGGRKYTGTSTNVNVPGGSGGGAGVGDATRVGGTGGTGYNGNNTISSTIVRGGAGGAAGYNFSSGAGAGGGGGSAMTSAAAGSGGGGGGGGARQNIGGTVSEASATDLPGAGGGVGILGLGSNGTIGANLLGTSDGNAGSGGPGSGGSGITYGGGGTIAQNGGSGAVRIIWPGQSRQFPSTRTADE